MNEVTKETTKAIEFTDDERNCLMDYLWDSMKSDPEDIDLLIFYTTLVRKIMSKKMFDIWLPETAEYFEVPESILQHTEEQHKEK